MSGTKNITDLTYLESIANGNQEFFIQLIEIFLEQIDEFTNGFKEYFSKKDWKNIVSLAHKAKASVISMGLEELGTDLKSLEIISNDLFDKGLEDKEIEAQILSKIENFIVVCEQARKELIEIINKE